MNILSKVTLYKLFKSSTNILYMKKWSFVHDVHYFGKWKYCTSMTSVPYSWYYKCTYVTKYCKSLLFSDSQSTGRIWTGCQTTTEIHSYDASAVHKSAQCTGTYLFHFLMLCGTGKFHNILIANFCMFFEKCHRE